MKWTLLVFIKIYWLLIPASKRRRCLFKVSCSNHVYKETLENGFFKGLGALRFRFENCRPGYALFAAPDDTQRLILKSGIVMMEEDISERLLDSTNYGISNR